MTLDAQIGLTRKRKSAKTWEKKKKLPPLKKELFAVSLGPFGIPDVFTLGPQISIRAVEVSLEGQIDLVVGGTIAMAHGTLNIDFNGKENTWEGLNVTFTPVFKASYSLTARLEFGLPIAFEFGLDVLTGKFKKTVGFIEKPTIYATASAGVSNGDRKCKDGVQLRVGVDNTVSVQAFDLWERDLFSRPLYDHGIGCVSAKGFEAKDVDDDVAMGAVGNVVKDVIDSFGDDLRSKVEYLILMDEAEETILVSGTDGGVYLVKTKEAYDLSAPWGSVGKHGTITADTFGRLINYRPVPSGDKYFELIEISVHDPASMPDDNFAVALQPFIYGKFESGQVRGMHYILSTAALYSDDEDDSSPDFRFYGGYAPIFRETKNGLRLHGGER